MSTFVSLLYAKAVNINEDDNPALYWKQRNGLLKKQYELANAIYLIQEANSLSILEYSQYKQIKYDSLSTRLYFKSLDLIKQLGNERIYLDLKLSIDNFHAGLRKWSSFETDFFLNDDQNAENRQQTKLTFENYSDYVQSIRDDNLLIRNWEQYIQSAFANLLGYACSSMSLLGKKMICLKLFKTYFNHFR